MRGVASGRPDRTAGGRIGARGQRRIVGLAVLATVAALTLTPKIGDDAGAQAANASYQPFSCAQSGGTAQGRRNDIQLNTGGSFNAAGRVYPCLAGAKWHLETGNVTTSSPDVAIGQIRNAYGRALPSAVKFAAAGDRTDLVQLVFSNLLICSDDNTPVAECPASGTKDIQLYAESAGTPDPKPVDPYRLTIKPDQAITLGGDGVWTEVLATPDSTFTVPGSQVPLGALGCSVAGGTFRGGILGFGGTCQLTASAFAGGLVQFLTGGSSFTLLGLKLDFYYLVSHKASPTDPYTEVPSDGSGNPLNSIQLPNTTISVG